MRRLYPGLFSLLFLLSSTYTQAQTFARESGVGGRAGFNGAFAPGGRGSAADSTQAYTGGGGGGGGGANNTDGNAGKGGKGGSGKDGHGGGNGGSAGTVAYKGDGSNFPTQKTLVGGVGASGDKGGEGGGVFTTGDAGGGGGGGGGGDALVISGTGNIEIKGYSITGGRGGKGGDGGDTTLEKGDGSGGGGGAGGGAGLRLLTEREINLSGTTITGGQGGNGGALGGAADSKSGASGSGGSGNDGLVMHNGGTVTVLESSVIRGGAGGSAQTAAFRPGYNLNGAAGNGGIGVRMITGGTLFIKENSSVLGGNAGNDENKNVGVLGGIGVWSDSGASTITAAGSISCGLGGHSGCTAVQLNGGKNRLELWNGYQIVGNVVATAQNENQPDTLALGGIQDGNFDLSAIGNQYTGFNRFEKSGAGTWILTNPNQLNTKYHWNITNGVLQGDANSIQGDVSFTPVSGGTSSMRFNQGSAGIYSGKLDGTGKLTKQGAAVLTMNADSTAFTGKTDITAGNLHVGDASHLNTVLGGDVNVRADATLGGHGKVSGSVELDADAYLAPGGIAGNKDSGIGTLSIGGNLTLNSSTQLDYEFGTPGSNFTRLGLGDSTHVTGTLNLNNAILRLIPNIGFAPGVYNIFTYGTLGSSGASLQMQQSAEYALQHLSTAKQINLLKLPLGAKLDFWDGEITTAHTGGAIGGTGSWTTNSNNWTDQNGNVHGLLQSPGYAIFSGTAGKVTVAGTQSVHSMQFTVDGYELTGGTLELVGTETSSGTNSPVIRVGDGSRRGATYNAIINTVLTGNQGLRYVDAGKAVINGLNTYKGGTTISGTTLAITQDENLGEVSDPVTLDGGSLEITQSFVSSRRTMLTNNGGRLQATAGVTFTPQIISDKDDSIASLEIAGEGAIRLIHANDYSGGTLVSGSKLYVGKNGTLGESISPIIPLFVIVNGLTDSTGTRGLLQFEAGSNAGFSAISINRGGQVVFDSASAGTSSFTNNETSQILFKGTSDAANAEIDNYGVVDISQLTNNQISIGSVAGTGAISLGKKQLILGGLHRDDTITGVISDNQLGGSVAKIGTGILTLSGVNTYTGGTTIQNGTLIVGDATHPTATLVGAVKVETGATLRGHGTIGGSVNNFGTVRPGASIGTLTIQGDYTQQPGSIFAVDVEADDQASLLKVKGTATIHDNTQVSVIAGHGAWKPETTYTILEAEGGLNGQFTSLNTNLAFLTPALAYTSHDVLLTFIRKDVPFIDITQTPNQRATAQAVAQLRTDNPIIEAILSLDAPMARHAFDQLSADIYPSSRKAMLDSNRYVRNVMSEQSQGQHGQIQERAGYNAHVWANTWGHWGRTRTDGNAATMRADGGGVLIGSDLSIGKTSRAGLLLGYVDDRLKLKDREAKATGHSVQFGAYGRTSLDAITVEGSVIYGHHRSNVQRDIAFGGFKDNVDGKIKGESISAHVEASYPLKVSDTMQVSPFGGFTYTHLQTKQVKENGQFAALSIAKQESDHPETALGVRAEWQKESINTHLSVGWLHALKRTTQNTMMFTHGASPFVIQGLPLSRHTGVLKGGVQWRLAKDVTLNADYIGQFAKKALDQAAQASIEWHF